MKPIIRAALTVSVLLALLAGVIMLLSDRQAQADLFSYFDKCDGQPCYLGIVPGKTSWEAALATLEEMHGIQFDPDTNIAVNPPGFRGSALVFDAGHSSTLVGGIDLDMRSSDVSVGTLVLQFGNPCAVNLEELPNTEILMYASGMWVDVFISELDAGVLKPTTPVFEISLFQGVTSCDPLPGNLANHRWKGFARYTN